MVGENKILTVSYGTFSCTLEGFEDPFLTMKAMAEYFRDLAERDRFFGAEPPQPDTEMLQRIAERTVQQPVSAEFDQNTIVLRQAERRAGPVLAASIAVPLGDPPHTGDAYVDDTFDEDASESDAFEDVAPVPASPETSTGAPVVHDPDVETVAQKLQRIRSAVSRDAGRSQEEATDYSEDEHASDLGDADALSTDAAPQIEAAATAPITLDPIAEYEDEPDAQEEVVETDADVTVATPPQDADLAPDDAVEIEADQDDQSEPLPVTDEDASDAAEGEEPRRRIVVQKISRAALAAVQNKSFDPDAEIEALGDDGQNDPDDATDDALLSDEEESDLMRALEAPDHDADDGDISLLDDDPEEEFEISEVEPTASEEETPPAEDVMDEEARAAEEEARAARKARRPLPSELEDEDAALERLMAATSNRLDGDESATRRASIAHLKAAVAATKADSSLANSSAQDEARQMDRYRKDLARVVRPGRATPNSEAEPSGRPQPLVLVSEQRIDDIVTDKSEEPLQLTETVQPRPASQDLEEVLASEANATSAAIKGGKDFSEYAENTSATELPDLLEAAAAHFTYVENVTQFTRPMLMRKITAVQASDGITREAGLRSFGALLREGKIVKTKNGKFEIATASRFAPEARYAGE